jgi:Prefoldin subunit
LKQKIPELQKSIAAIQTLVAKRTTTPQEQPDEKDNNPIHIRYALCDNIYAKARLSNSTTSSSSTTESGVGQPVVYLWLGANVMLEYEYDAALMFLRNNHERAERDLSTVSSDLSFVRDDDDKKSTTVVVVVVTTRQPLLLHHRRRHESTVHVEKNYRPVRTGTKNLRCVYVCVCVYSEYVCAYDGRQAKRR